MCPAAYSAGPSSRPLAIRTSRTTGGRSPSSSSASSVTETKWSDRATSILPSDGRRSGDRGGGRGGELVGGSVETEELAERALVAVVGAEQPAPLQLGHDQVDERVQWSGQVRREDDEAVGGALLELLLDVVGDLL